MLIKPTFMDGFVCKASDCKHTCCSGWEIEVDPDTAERYLYLLNEHERARIETVPDGVFLCREGESCRFLRSDGLCELIISHGEEALCDICREHPRFYSYSQAENICEVGVGLCCERAAELWLSADPSFICEDDGYEADEAELSSLEKQLELIKAVLSGEVSLDIFEPHEKKALFELFGSLETLETLDFSDDMSHGFYAEQKRLAAYYIFRWYFEFPKEALKLAAASCLAVLSLGGDFFDAARRISCEFEYDRDNTLKLIDFLSSI